MLTVYFLNSKTASFCPLSRRTKKKKIIGFFAPLPHLSSLIQLCFLGGETAIGVDISNPYLSRIEINSFHEAVNPKNFLDETKITFRMVYSLFVLRAPNKDFFLGHFHGYRLLWTLQQYNIHSLLGNNAIYHKKLKS